MKQSLRLTRVKTRVRERGGSKERKRRAVSAKFKLRGRAEARTEAGRNERPDGKSGRRKERDVWKEESAKN